MAKQLMIAENPFPEDPVPSDEEEAEAEGQKRQEIKSSESVE